MKLSRSQLNGLLLAIVIMAIGVVTSIVGIDVPPAIKPYLWWSWPVLGALFFIFIILRALQPDEKSHEPSRFHGPLQVEVKFPSEAKEKPKPPTPKPPQPDLVHPALLGAAARAAILARRHRICRARDDRFDERAPRAAAAHRQRAVE